MSTRLQPRHELTAASPDDPAAPVLDVRGLTIDFDLGAAGPQPVIIDVDLHVRPGERVALVGESGSGKSVTTLSLLRLLPAVAELRAERFQVAGAPVLELAEKQLNRVRGRDVAMVFQDPTSSLNPLLRIEQQFLGPLRRHRRVSRRAARDRAVELLTQVGIPDPRGCLSRYPHELSGGMRQRVMIAVAVSCGPRLLLADEPTTALDVTIQAQILDLLRGLTDELQMGCVLVTHDLGVVARFASRMAVMYAGRIVEEGPVTDVFADPRHPYTRALLASIPTPGSTGRLHQIEGSPPGLGTRASGCAFRTRCELAHDRCGERAPRLLTHRPPSASGAGRAVACHAEEER